MMNRKKLGLIGGIVLLTIGGIAVLNLNGDNSIVELFKSPRDKQLDYLKKHEQEIVEWIKSNYPKIESIQFDWDTLRVGPVSNGIMTTHYNLSVTGKFNNLVYTDLAIDFRLEKQDDLPNVKNIGMLNHPSILKEGIWLIYD